MDRKESLLLLKAMIDYFELGNQETDAAAKAIVESDFQQVDFWQSEIEKFRNGIDWTGLRAPEAEIVAAKLRVLKRMVESNLN